MNDITNYISTSAAAKQEGVSVQRIKGLLAQHRISGAKKHGGVWFIPKGFTVLPSKQRTRAMAKMTAAPADGVKGK